MYPIKSGSAIDAAHALNIHIGFFGVPCELLSDGGSEFTNQIIKEYLNFIGTEHVLMMAHSHEENSIVERSNRETWKWLRAILHDKKIGKKQITKAIPFVTRIHNSTVVKSLGFSPGQVIFGERVELDRSILLPEAQRDPTAVAVSGWMHEQQELQDVILKIATNYQKKHDEGNRVKRMDTGTENTLTDFPLGSYVLVAYPENSLTKTRRPNKLHMMFRGPYKVINREHNEFTIENLVDKKTLKKSIFLLRPFHYDAARTNPHTIALNDFDNEYNVEKIISHTGHWGRKAHMKFMVRWSGYEADYDTEEPWAVLKNNEMFHEYLTITGHPGLIPK